MDASYTSKGIIYQIIVERSDQCFISSVDLINLIRLCFPLLITLNGLCSMQILIWLPVYHLTTDKGIWYIAFTGKVA